MRVESNSKLIQMKLFIGYVVPSALFILSALITMIPWQMPYFSTIKPELPLVVLFFFMCMKPDSIPPIVVFLGAIVIDIFQPVPLGYYSLLYFLMYGLILWRSPSLNLPNLILFFAEFAAVTFIFYLLSWIFNNIIGNGVATHVNIIFAWSMTLCSFWILFPLLQKSYKFYPAAHLRHYNRQLQLDKE